MKFHLTVLPWVRLGIAAVRIWLNRLASHTRKRVFLQHSLLAGFQYYEAGQLWHRLRPGALLELRRNPDNPVDGKAVEVYWRGHKLGHLPRTDNAIVSRLLDRGMKLRAKIQALRASENPWERVQVRVEWEK
jgi:HIRAN domain